jgi:hypothetical protein
VQCLEEVVMPSGVNKELYCFKTEKSGAESLQRSPNGSWIAVDGYGDPNVRGSAVQTFNLVDHKPGAVHYGIGVRPIVRDDGALALEVPDSKVPFYQIGFVDGRKLAPEPGEPLAWTTTGALLVRSAPWKREACGNFFVKAVPLAP